jgi:hypothetical protein
MERHFVTDRMLSESVTERVGVERPIVLRVVHWADLERDHKWMRLSLIMGLLIELNKRLKVILKLNF